MIRRLAVVAAMAIAVFATSASARHHADRHVAVDQTNVQQFCGTRYCADTLAKDKVAPARRVADRHPSDVGTERWKHRQPDRGESASAGRATIRSGKTGETATVAAEYAGRFQSFLDDLEAHGATIYYMGGIRSGHCSIGSQHPCGWAVDFCQDYYGHVSGARDCRLPEPAEFHKIVVAHGLHDGSVWCRSDYGHVQAKDSGGCNIAPHGSWGHGRVRLATMTGKIVGVDRRRHHHYGRRLRYARR